MSEHSRRHFIRHASVGAVAIGAATIVPAATSADAAAPDTTAGGVAHDGPFTVWVTDPGSGEIAVLVGEQKIVHHDKALAATLARIAGRGATS